MKLVLAALAVSLLGCSPGSREHPADVMEQPCSGLECQIVDCAKRHLPDTTISGTVFAPNGSLKLYGVTVYVPLTDPPPFEDGAACTRCQEQLPGAAAAHTESTADGTFLLAKAPSGANIPLVITIGKWRKKIVLDQVTECTDNPLPAAMTSLPKTRAEGEMPRIAISTGACDALECLVRKLGVADSEFTNPTGPGSIHLYANGGVAKYGDDTMFPTSDTLWGDMAELKKYDLVLNGCECMQNGATKTQAMMDNVKAYADLGGRLFLSHYHNIWIEGDKAMPTKRPAVWPDIATCDQFDIEPAGNIGAIDQQSNPKGPAFADWMLGVGGSSTKGRLTIAEARVTCNAIDSTKAERWLYMNGSNELQTFQFTTPNEAAPEERCGKVVFSDMHVASGSTSSPTMPFPTGCNAGGLTPQEKALAFMLFDISTCVGPIF